MSAPSCRRVAPWAAGILLTAALPLAAVPSQAAPVPVPVDTRARPVAAASADSLFPEVGHRSYDVKHYDIALTYRPKSRAITATTTIEAEADHKLSGFTLDLEGLEVSRVRVDGHTATFRRKGTRLEITPRKPVHGSFTSTITYAGVPMTHIDPDGAKDGWIPTPDGATALNEPVGAMTWFPNNNTPRDKARYDIAITVPSTLEAASNGVLRSRRTTGSTTTWIWRQRQPMASYLAMVSIGDYDVYHSTLKLRSGRKLPVWSFIDPALGSLSAERKKLPEIIRFEEERFGRYPFDSAGIVVKKINVDYALETQDRPFFDGTPDESTMVHEFAHQWYGDSVTPKDWGDIWLNEGFATYTEWLWAAAHGGPSTADTFAKIYAENPAGSELWSPAPIRLSDPADLFGESSYTRGALTLEALRQKVGSKDLATILHRWASDKRGRTVSTAQFIKLSEHVSGRDLDDFFRIWLSEPTKPAGYQRADARADRAVRPAAGVRQPG